MTMKSLSFGVLEAEKKKKRTIFFLTYGLRISLEK